MHLTTAPRFGWGTLLGRRPPPLPGWFHNISAYLTPLEAKFLSYFCVFFFFPPSSSLHIHRPGGDRTNGISPSRSLLNNRGGSLPPGNPPGNTFRVEKHHPGEGSPKSIMSKKITGEKHEREKSKLEPFLGHSQYLLPIGPWENKCLCYAEEWNCFWAWSSRKAWRVEIFNTVRAVWRWAKAWDEYQRAKPWMCWFDPWWDAPKRRLFPRLAPSKSANRSLPPQDQFSWDFQKSNRRCVKGFWTWWEMICCEKPLGMEELIVGSKPQIGIDFVRVRQNHPIGLRLAIIRFNPTRQLLMGFEKR